MTLQTLMLLLVPAFLCLQNAVTIEGDGCPQSIPTENVVEACPADSTEWIKAKEKKLCHLMIQNCTDKDRFQYHCLPNKFLDILVEVCAPNKVIVGQHCPYYDMQRKTIEPNFNQPCNSGSNPCQPVYSSSEVYKYQICYDEIKEKETKRVTVEKRISLEVSDSYQELAIGLYMICGLLGVVLILHVMGIRFYSPYPCCGICPCKRHYQFDKNKNWSEKDEEMKLHEQEERLDNGS